MRLINERIKIEVLFENSAFDLSFSILTTNTFSNCEIIELD